MATNPPHPLATLDAATPSSTPGIPGTAAADIAPVAGAGSVPGRHTHQSEASTSVTKVLRVGDGSNESQRERGRE